MLDDISDEKPDEIRKEMPGEWWRNFSSGLLNTAFDPARLEPRLGHPLRLLVVDIGLQTLTMIIDGDVAKTFPVSTSKYSAGCHQDTGCTPLGWHSVAEKIGAEAPVGTIFKGRRASGVAEDLMSDVSEDLITSRILWLSGRQAGFNLGGQVDSKNRYIYIHGTAQEHWLGIPKSEGCIRMANTDVIELFSRVELETPVFIGL